jgi:hypothetical protein
LVGGSCYPLFIPCYVDILSYIVDIVKDNPQFSLHFQGFPGFAGLRVFRPDLIPGAGGFGGGSVGRVTPEMPDTWEKTFFKNSAKIKKDIPVPFSNIYDTIGNLPLS